MTHGATTRVSVATGGTQATGGASDEPAISDDGRYVAFQSDATNLVTGEPTPRPTSSATIARRTPRSGYRSLPPASSRPV